MVELTRRREFIQASPDESVAKHAPAARVQRFVGCRRRLESFPSVSDCVPIFVNIFVRERQNVECSLAESFAVPGNANPRIMLRVPFANRVLSKREKLWADDFVFAK